jgi:hypothetical protein
VADSHIRQFWAGAQRLDGRSSQYQTAWLSHLDRAAT